MNPLPPAISIFMARIPQNRDRGITVLVICKNLALLPETFFEKCGHKRKINQLDGNLLVKLPVRTACKINGAHSAVTDQMIQLIG
jgi:hypothetical protein